MYISLNWIKEFVDLNGINIEDLGNRFTMATAEIDGIVEIGKDINNVVVGKIISVEDHPNSKKLHIVKVDVGNEIVQSVCGAPNVEVGMLIPFAKNGGSIKKLPEIKPTLLGGVESNGVCCAASELGISDDHSGLMVLENVKVGTNIKDIIDIDDVIIEIDNKSLTNRPDLWGHYGIAREIAALYNRELKSLSVDEIKESEKLSKTEVVVEDAEKCFRYSCVSIDNIKVKTSPINMQTRLYYCGMRGISLLVDLTNYLMLEVGQPMHAFDKKYMNKVIVKSTIEQTKFVTLDGTEKEIPQDTLMICNENMPVAIAGIMGGQNSEVSDDTTTILLESANFEGSSTRRNATKIGIRTEASARYEKMLDPEMTVLAIKRFIKLLKDIDKNVVVSSALTDVYPNKYKKIIIDIDKAYIDRYIGQNIEKEKIIEILKSLEFGIDVDGDKLKIEVPSFRATKDVSMKADLIEEISRVYGYDNIQPVTTEVVLEPLIYNQERIIDHKVKEILAENFGLSEVHSHVWYDNKENIRLGIGTLDGLKLINSLDGNNNTLRDSIAPIMINFAAENKKNFDGFGMFEIGSVFPSKEKFDEHKNLCLLIASKNESEDNLFYKAKGILTSLLKTIKNTEFEYSKADKSLEYSWVHPVKTAEINHNNKNFGYISVVHPKIKENVDKKLNMVIVEIDMFKVHDIKETNVKYKEPSKYPEVTFDLSFLVDKWISFESICNDLSEFKNDLLLDYKFIDIYNGKGLPEDKKSMTFSFRVASKETTLTSEEIDGVRKSIIEHAGIKGYSLR